VPIFKASIASKAAAAFQSLWLATGQPSLGAAPANITGANCTTATAGAAGIQTPAGANKLYLARLQMAGTTVGVLTLYDRLWANAGMSGTVLTAQAFTPPTLPRYTDGFGVEPWLEVYSIMGSTAANASLTYQDASLGAGQTAVCPLPAAAPVAGQMYPFNFPAGGKGVITCSSLILSGTLTTAGNFGVTLLKRIADIPIILANSGVSLDSFGLGLPEIKSGACLAGMVLCSTTSTGIFTGTLVVAEG